MKILGLLELGLHRWNISLFLPNKSLQAINYSFSQFVKHMRCSIQSFSLILYMKMMLYDLYQTSFHSVKWISKFRAKHSY